jgi:hydrogenase maturation protease
MRILIAGIGNIFLGDDGFGCEVAHRLTVRGVPDGVTVADFGVRSYDLAFALTDNFDAVILVDAVGRGSSPGTLYLIEPRVEDPGRPENESLEAHTMDPVAVIHMARCLGNVCGKLFLVGCEAAVCGNDENQMGLSAVVREVLPEAVAMIDSLVGDLLGQNQAEREIAGFIAA